LSFRKRRNHNKLANHYEIPRTSEGQKKERQSLNLMTLGSRDQPIFFALALKKVKEI